MASLQENLSKIAGEAILGVDMRTAIAEAISTVNDDLEDGISDLQTAVQETVMHAQLTDLGNGDYQLALSNATVS